MTGKSTIHNRPYYRIFLLFLLLLAPSLTVRGQVSDFMKRAMDANPDALYDEVFAPNIRTVQFSKTGLQNSPPLLQLNSNDRISLNFDEVGSKSATNYQFTIIHCDADWVPSNIFQSDYIDGLYQDYLSGYSVSMNTYQPYIHYTLDFPTNNMRPKMSGNYILKVFKNDPNQPVMLLRFYVFEQQVSVGATAQRASYARYRDAFQEIDFQIDTKDLSIMNPYNDIKVVLKQNWRWDNEIRNLKPLYVQNTTLIYNYEEGNLFRGLNEYRFFDTRDFRFKGLGVKYFTFDSLYNAHLFVDEDRSINAWNSYVDQNGAYIVGSRSGQDPNTDADYTMVHFKLRPSYRDGERPVYVFGGLTNWQIDDRFKMQYDERDMEYKLDVKLKQGVYDYYYVVVDDKGQIDASLYEGSHWETENNYTVLVYYRQPSLSADLLVGIARTNTASH